MIAKQSVDRIGGVASMLAGLVCLWLAVGDRETGHSIWKVFAVMCVILVLNGVAMMRLAQRNGRGSVGLPGSPNRDASRVAASGPAGSTLPGTTASGSNRV